MCLVAKNSAPTCLGCAEIVCIIRADEITLSPVHTGGKTEINSGMHCAFPALWVIALIKVPMKQQQYTK